MTRCPLCGGEPRALLLDARAVGAELAARQRFFTRGRDLTEVTLGQPADVLRCERCGILIRDGAPGDDIFRDDRYGMAVLRWLHEAHAAAFRAKHRDYGALLAPRAQVVEIGSYAGGFLRAASEWGWRPIGIDIGGDTARFTAALGFEMSADLPAQAIDGVFIWNCFEQISDPHATLALAHRALRDGGLLVIRVPDAQLYATSRDRRVLAANGFLGWPHRFGYSADALGRLSARHGFALERVLRRAPLPPLPALHRGWLELTFRKVSARAAAA
jgi:SAM-dependent methyltransferase